MLFVFAALWCAPLVLSQTSELRDPFASRWTLRDPFAPRTALRDPFDNDVVSDKAELRDPFAPQCCGPEPPSKGRQPVLKIPDELR
jgi:hypothetical protein